MARALALLGGGGGDGDGGFHRPLPDYQRSHALAPRTFRSASPSRIEPRTASMAESIPLAVEFTYDLSQA